MSNYYSPAPARGRPRGGTPSAATSRPHTPASTSASPSPAAAAAAAAYAPYLTWNAHNANLTDPNAARNMNVSPKFLQDAIEARQKVQEMLYGAGAAAAPQPSTPAKTAYPSTQTPGTSTFPVGGSYATASSSSYPATPSASSYPTASTSSYSATPNASSYPAASTSSYSATTSAYPLTSPYTPGAYAAASGSYSPATATGTYPSTYASPYTPSSYTPNPYSTGIAGFTSGSIVPAGAPAPAARPAAGGAGGAGDEDGEGDDDVLPEMADDDYEAQETFQTRSKNDMELLMRNLQPEQYARFEVYRRNALPKQAVRKVIQQTLGLQISPPIAQIVGGFAKVFVGEIVEKARAVQERRGETGPLSPDHLREAYRMYHKETGAIGSARPVRGKKLFVR